MSNETTQIGVEFSATTAAAVAEVDNLSAAVREATTAARDAGKEQASLGREVAATRAAQIIATEATRKARDAQQMHTLTVAKFGAASKEATASEAKLTKATEEATRAATAAAVSLNKTAQAASAAAEAEDGKLSPATRRAAAQLERMGKDAERTGNDLHKLALQSKAPAGGFDAMGLASGKLMSVLGPAALGGTLMALAGWLGEAGEKTLQYETALANLPFSLDSATAATRGLVSQQTLVAAASAATALKVTRTADDFEILATASTKLAAKLGQPADALLNNLVTALGRGSTELLDNAGIVLKTGEAQERYAESIGKTVAQLTDEEKAGAFKVEAMKAIKAAADATTVAFDSNAAAVARLKVQGGDAWDSISRGAVNAFGYIIADAQSAGQGMRETIEAEMALKVATDELTQEMMRSQGWSQGFKDLAANAAIAAADVLVAKGAVAGWQAILTDPATWKQGEAAVEQERQKAALITEEAKQAERLAKAYAKVAADNEAFLQAQAEASIFIGPMPAEKPKKRGGARKKEVEFTDPGDVARARIHDGRVDSVSDEPRIAQEEETRERLYEIQAAGLERDLEIIDARGMAEQDAQAAREALLQRQLDAEQAFARQQMRFARTDEQREKAQTRMEAVEHQRRLVSLRKLAAAEEAEQARKVAITEKVTARVSDLGTAMVEAAWQAAEGQRGAGLQALGDYLKTVSKQMAVKAAVETALGVSALAGIVTAGLAPGHFTAAGVALAAAVAAGGAGIGLSAAGDARAAEGKPAGAAAGAANGPSGGSSGGSAGGEREKRELDAQEVPVSYFDQSRPPAAVGDGGVVINIVGGTFIGTKGPEALAQEIEKILRRGKAAGAR